MSLELTVTDRVAVIELDRPKRLNALTVEMVERLGALASSAVTEGARAIVLTGRGGAFCAGADLSVVNAALAGDPHPALTPLVEGLHASILRLRAVPAPIIAAVEGTAIGAGLGLALAADLRVLAADAKLVPGYLGIGVSPDGGVSYLLTRMLGAGRAMSLLLRNRTLTAADAVALGLAESSVAPGSALAAARELAADLTRTPPLALLRVRELLDQATRQGLAGQLDLEQRLVTELWPTHDFREGVGAFLERRAPEFRGE